MLELRFYSFQAILVTELIYKTLQKKTNLNRMGLFGNERTPPVRQKLNNQIQEPLNATEDQAHGVAREERNIQAILAYTVEV